MSGGVCLDATARSRKAWTLKTRPVSCGGSAIVPNGPWTLRQNAADAMDTPRPSSFISNPSSSAQWWFTYYLSALVSSLSPSRKGGLAA